ncbi:MAG: AAA family ATPase, partial [Oscillospiraceae bacterium]|nr:AAA family ATPase [Oscillospiraceae bacterium]
MKIKKVSTEQFAGIHDKEVEFCDGINVVYGKNESGKSTLVNLISRTFFQDADLGKSDKNDKEFVNRYFPVGAKSDFIQGKIVFEAENGEYSITKEWIAPDKKTKENP